MMFVNIFFMMFSLVSIEIKDISIIGIDKILDLFKQIKDKNYIKLINYINFKIIIRIRMFEKLTIMKITLNSNTIKKIAKFFIKIFNKRKLKNKKINNEIDNKVDNNIENKVDKSTVNKNKINSKIVNKKINSKSKSKKKTKKFFKKAFIKVLIKTIKIPELKIKCEIGLARADITAVISGMINLLISIILAEYCNYKYDCNNKLKNFNKKITESDSNKINNKKNKNILDIDEGAVKYKILPIYSNNVETNFNFLLGISSKFY